MINKEIVQKEGVLCIYMWSVEASLFTLFFPFKLPLMETLLEHGTPLNSLKLIFVDMILENKAFKQLCFLTSSCGKVPNPLQKVASET